MDIQPLMTAWVQILIGGRTNTEPSLPRTACQRTFQPNERGRERTAAGREGACLLTLARVLKERWGGGREGGLSPYFNSCLIRLLAAKHLPLFVLYAALLQ